MAGQDPYHEPIFKAVFTSDQIPKEKDIQTRSAYINVDTCDKQGSHWLSIFVEKDQCEVFDNYGLPLHWYEPCLFVTWVFKHYQDVSSNVGQLQTTDSNTCGHCALFSYSDDVPADKQNGIITGYTISYQSQTGNDNVIASVGANDRQKNLTELKEYVNYNITVFASTVKGYGPASDPIDVRTKSDSK